jgi:hypothetical protein
MPRRCWACCWAGCAAGDAVLITTIALAGGGGGTGAWRADAGSAHDSDAATSAAAASHCVGLPGPGARASAPDEGSAFAWKLAQRLDATSASGAGVRPPNAQARSGALAMLRQGASSPGLLPGTTLIWSTKRGRQ